MTAQFLSGAAVGSWLTVIGMAVAYFIARHRARQRAMQQYEATLAAIRQQFSPATDMPAFTERVVARGRN